MSHSAQPAGDELTVVYDAECPFCSRFVLLYRVRQLVGRVRLIDARSGDPIVEEIRSRHYDLDEGMVVYWQGQYYHGAEAMHLLALLGTDSTAFNRVNRLLFSRPRLARRLYPRLVAGRNMTLRILGRPPIRDEPAPELRS